MTEINDRLSLWSARFVSRSLERDYQSAIAHRHFRFNLISVCVALTLFAGYSIADFNYFDEPQYSLMIRGSVTIACLMLLSLIRFTRSSTGYQTLFTAICMLMGLGVDAIIATYPNQYSMLYVALIQGAVLFGFLLKLDFPRFAWIFGSSFAGFVLATTRMSDSSDALVRVSSLFFISFICLVGVYFLQRYHRRDYLQTRIIERQNDQLSDMLADVQEDNKRKLAAMNMLVHFVKTPVHQISGFTDVVLAALKDKAEEGDRLAGCIESAQYIKTASDDLTENVTKLLEYHRLDDLEPDSGVVEFDLRDHLEDAIVRIDSDHFKADLQKGLTINYHETALPVAVKHFVKVARDRLEEGVAVTLFARQVESGAEICIVDDGVPMSDDEFRELSKPLTQIDSYLGRGGSEIPMSIRIVTRVSEICGGGLDYCPSTVEGNVLRWTLHHQVQSSPAANAG